MLLEKNIKPSVQRLSILEYLATSKSHPTLDEIYEHISVGLKVLSLTTLYSTLLLFEKKGLVKCFYDGKEKRFDFISTPHSHFICEVCGGVYDITGLEKPDIKEIEGHIVKDVDVLLRGVCSKCRREKK